MHAWYMDGVRIGLELYNYMHVGALSPTYWGRGVTSRPGIVLETNDARELVHLETGLNSWGGEGGRENGGIVGDSVSTLWLTH